MPPPTPRTVLVTGASSGIGEATARSFLERGWTVYAAARRTERMESLARAGALVHPLDVTCEASIAALVSRVEADHGHLEVLVNNAGIGVYGSVEEVPMDEARRQFEVNLFGIARLTQLVLPAMRAAGSVSRIARRASCSVSPHRQSGAQFSRRRGIMKSRLSLPGWTVNPRFLATN